VSYTDWAVQQGRYAGDEWLNKATDWHLDAAPDNLDEKDGSFDIVFLPKFAQENFCEGGLSRCKQPDVKQLVRLRIGGSVQPELLIVDLNHCFVERNLIRRFTGVWL